MLLASQPILPHFLVATTFAQPKMGKRFLLSENPMQMHARLRVIKKLPLALGIENFFLPMSLIVKNVSTSHGAFFPYFSSWVDVISLCNAASERHLKIGRRSHLTIRVKLKWNGARKNSFARSMTWNNALSSFVGRRCGVSPSNTKWPKNWMPRHTAVVMNAWNVVVSV